MSFDISDDQRQILLQQAARHEQLADALRELAEFGRPSDERIAAAPVVHGWHWAAAECLTVRGSWHDGAAGYVDGSLGSAIANMPDMSAIMTARGWFVLGVPDDVRAPTSETVQ